MKHSFYKYKTKHRYLSPQKIRRQRQCLDAVSKLLSFAVCILLLPIVCTLLMQGLGDSGITLPQMPKEEPMQEAVLEESVFVGILANQIPVNMEQEAMKAQAVIVRTNCMRALENGEELPEGLSEEEMLRLWGRDNFSVYYNQLRESIQETDGEVLLHEGAYIQADFHAVSAGYTRDAAEVYGTAAYPYLQSIDSRMDIVSEDFLKVEFYTAEEFLKKGEKFFPETMKDASAAQLAEQFVITKKDKAGYVLEVQIGENKYSGEELRLAYGWHSAAFSIKEIDGEIRVVTKGYGHGLGLSLYGARALAKEGYTYQEILNYFYKDISVSKG